VAFNFCCSFPSLLLPFAFSSFTPIFVRASFVSAERIAASLFFHLQTVPTPFLCAVGVIPCWWKASLPSCVLLFVFPPLLPHYFSLYEHFCLEVIFFSLFLPGSLNGRQTPTVCLTGHRRPIDAKVSGCGCSRSSREAPHQPPPHSRRAAAAAEHTARTPRASISVCVSAIRFHHLPPEQFQHQKRALTRASNATTNPSLNVAEDFLASLSAFLLYLRPVLLHSHIPAAAAALLPQLPHFPAGRIL
jgi:hypothetical protein